MDCNDQKVRPKTKRKARKRIVRSTLFAETYALLEAIDFCIFLRRMASQLLNIENIKIECYVDSKTLCDSIASNKLNEDKRLRHEIECLKETIELDNVEVHWISTKLQVANVFTKAGAPTNLILEVLFGLTAFNIVHAQSLTSRGTVDFTVF